MQAHTIADKDGRILLLGDMQHGEANIAGTLDASAPHGGNGGFIETSAAKVTVADEARITAHSENGKTGTWLIDPNDFTIAASGGNITGNTLSSQLAGSNVTISTVTQGTAGGNGDINVNDSVNWSANTLTFHAERNITINTAMNGSATAGLALEYGQGAVAAGNSATYTVNAPVNLASTGSFSTKLGSDGTPVTYTIVTSIGNAASSNDGTLQGIDGDLSGKYVLGADIDASATSAWNTAAGFTPIGDNSTNNSSSRYTGTFDGLGHVITGLTINRPATSTVGLFGYVDSSGVIRNVGLSGSSVTASSYVGQVAGIVTGTIANTYAQGSLTASSVTSMAGGLVGLLDHDATITNSYATGQISGVNNIGGLVGFSNYATVSTSYSTSNVTATSFEAAGLVGFLNGGAITNSYATGQISGANNAGGLVGFNNDNATISASYATGQVSGASYIGGLVGFFNNGAVSTSYATGAVTATGSQAGGLLGFLNSGTIANSYATGQVSGTDNIGGLVGFHNAGTISNTYATGLVTGSSTNVGGLTGFTKLGATISNSYWDTATTGASNGCGTSSTGTCSTTGASTTSMKNPFTFIDGGWDFTNIWGKSQSGSNNGYMVLRALNNSSYDDYVRLSNTNLSKTYGSANPSLASISLDGVGTGNVTLDWGSAITTATNVGAYSYGTATVLAVTDISSRSVYTDYGSGALTVNKAALTVTANNASKTYDGLAFSGGNGVSYSGFVNSENASVLSGTLRFGGTSQGARNAGSYTIVPSGLSAQNYDIAYINGALTVNKATISAITGITANNKTYDGTTAASLNTANAAFNGMIPGDALSVASATGNFANADPGMDKTVFITGLALGGDNAPNYVLANITAMATANISAITRSPLSPQQITITSNNNVSRGFFKRPDFDILSVRTEKADADAPLKGGNQTANFTKCISENNQYKTSLCTQ